MTTTSSLFSTPLEVRAPIGEQGVTGMFPWMIHACEFSGEWGNSEACYGQTFFATGEL